MRELLAAAPRGSYGWVCNFIGTPNSGSEWHGRPYRGGGELEQQIDRWQLYNTYFSVAAFMPGEGGGQARKKALFTRLLALVVDDATLDRLIGQPSWVLETSPNNFQIGILLNADDSNCADVALVDALMRKLFEDGLIGGDKSGNNAARYVRMPCGQNQKQRPTGHFDHVMRQWNPGQRLTLADAAAMLGVELDELREAVKAKAELGHQLAPSAGQGDKLSYAVGNIMRGAALHASINEIAASLVATSMPGGAVVNTLRALMDSSLAMRDDRFQERYDDIPRSVRTAQDKFSLPTLPALPASAEAGQIHTPREIVVSARTLLEMGGKPVDWLIHGYVEAGAMSMTFGPSGSGKSFLIIDQACCIATGTPWHFRKVKQGMVIIVCGEGHAGLGRRLKAWSVLNKVDVAEAPLYVTTRAVPFLDAAAVYELVAEIDKIVEKHGAPPVAIYIDTLARNFGAGDENSAQDASTFIAALDNSIRSRYGCHTGIVHHSGYTAGRARGSTALKGAMDQEFQVNNYGGTIKYSATKMKDAEPPEDISFKLVGGIDLGIVDGETVTGAALKVAGSLLDTKIYNEITVRQVLTLATEERLPSYVDIGKALSLTSKSAPQKLFQALIDLKLVEKLPGGRLGYVISEDGKKLLSHTGHYAMGGTTFDPDAPTADE